MEYDTLNINGSRPIRKVKGSRGSRGSSSRSTGAAVVIKGGGGYHYTRLSVLFVRIGVALVA